MYFVSQTADGKILRSKKQIVGLYAASPDCLTRIPPEDMKHIDLLSPTTYELFESASHNYWLRPSDALSADTATNLMNTCICVEGKVYIFNGSYILLDEIQKAPTIEKKVLFSRICKQIAYMNRILTAAESYAPSDILSDETRLLLETFFRERCLRAQQRYAEKGNIPHDICIEKNGELYLRYEGRHQALPAVLGSLTDSDLNAQFVYLAHIAATLHEIVAGQDTVA